MLNIILEFLGNQHLNCELIPKYGRSFFSGYSIPNYLGSVSKQYNIFIFLNPEAYRFVYMKVHAYDEFMNSSDH